MDFQPFEIKLEWFRFLVPQEQRDIRLLSSAFYRFSKVIYFKGSNFARGSYVFQKSLLSSKSYNDACAFLQSESPHWRKTGTIKINKNFPFYPGHCCLNSGAHLFNRQGTQYQNININSLIKTTFRLQDRYISTSEKTIADRDSVCYYSRSGRLKAIFTKEKRQTHVLNFESDWLLDELAVNFENRFMLVGFTEGGGENDSKLFQYDIESAKCISTKENVAEFKWRNNETFLGYTVVKNAPDWSLSLYDVRDLKSTTSLQIRPFKRFYIDEFERASPARYHVNDHYIAVGEENQSTDVSDVSVYDIRKPSYPMLQKQLHIGYTESFLPPYLLYPDPIQPLSIGIIDIFSGRTISTRLFHSSEHIHWITLAQVSNKWLILTAMDNELCFFSH